MTMWLVRNATTGRVLAWRVRRADGWFERAVGFLPRTRIAPEEGLWFERCHAVHTLGMRVPIDMVFLDKENRVVRIEPNVLPHKLMVTAKHAHTVAEFGPGFVAANPLNVGDRLEIEPVS